MATFHLHIAAITKREGRDRFKVGATRKRSGLATPTRRGTPIPTRLEAVFMTNRPVRYGSEIRVADLGWPNCLPSARAGIDWSSLAGFSLADVQFGHALPDDSELCHKL
jgi:hypothetical protein